MKRPFIALLTDFGHEDNYVGIMKGVILKVNPDVQIVDLTHSVEPQNLIQGALFLRSAYKYFPENTIFLCVVDPGVGSSRDPVIIRTANYTFVGPDNGLFAPILKEAGYEEIYTITEEYYFLKPVSHTFHGRDIFAPVAAHITKGVQLQAFGKRKDDYIHLEIPEARLNDDERMLHGEVIAIDRFGNLVTNIDQAFVQDQEERIRVHIKEQVFDRLSTSYAQHAQGSLLAIIGSKGYLEISVNRGSAQKALGAMIGEKVDVEYLVTREV